MQRTDPETQTSQNGLDLYELSFIRKNNITRYLIKKLNISLLSPPYLICETRSFCDTFVQEMWREKYDLFMIILTVTNPLTKLQHRYTTYITRFGKPSCVMTTC
jgi:hypothetical protein